MSWSLHHIHPCFIYEVIMRHIWDKYAAVMKQISINFKIMKYWVWQFLKIAKTLLNYCNLCLYAASINLWCNSGYMYNFLVIFFFMRTWTKTIWHFTNLKWICHSLWTIALCMYYYNRKIIDPMKIKKSHIHTQCLPQTRFQSYTLSIIHFSNFYFYFMGSWDPILIDFS